MGKLSVKSIENAKPQDRAYTVSDGDGLELRVATDGTKTWRVKYLVSGETVQKRYTLPRHYAASSDDGHLSLADARTEARAIQALARQGIDIKLKNADQRAAEEDRRKQEQKAREAAAKRLTVRALYEQWAGVELIRRTVNVQKETKRGLEKDVISVIGNRYADEIRLKDVMSILDTVKARGAKRMTNRLLEEMRQMFSYAVVRELISSDPTYLIKKKDAGGRERERDRVLSDDEIRTLPGKVDSSGLTPVTRHAIWVILATLCRIGELNKARLAHINLKAKTWYLPAKVTKNGKPHLIYLSDFACSHLKAMIDMSSSRVFLLPALTRTQGKDMEVCVNSITKQIYDRQRGNVKVAGRQYSDVLRLSGGKWTPHDLRRTGATMMSGRLGVAENIVEACLNHTRDKLKRTYQVEVSEQEKLDAWNRLGKQLKLLTEGRIIKTTTSNATRTVARPEPARPTLLPGFRLRPTRTQTRAQRA